MIFNNTLTLDAYLQRGEDTTQNIVGHIELINKWIISLFIVA